MSRNTKGTLDASSIQIRGARENNLRDIDVDVPRHGIIAIVGVSGSGKSSLLFRTIATEGEARHNLLGASKRKWNTPRRPACNSIAGLPFCLTVSQRSLTRNPRSTVATFTGLHESLRRLVIDHGQCICACG